MQCSQKPEEGVRSLELQLWVVVSPHVGKQNLGPLKEQQEFLTAEPSPQLQGTYFLSRILVVQEVGPPTDKVGSHEIKNFFIAKEAAN